MFSLEVFNYAVMDFSGVLSGSCLGTCSFCPVSGNCIEPDAENPRFVDATGVEVDCGFMCKSCNSAT
jgi:hypothetical protein